MLAVEPVQILPINFGTQNRKGRQFKEIPLNGPFQTKKILPRTILQHRKKRELEKDFEALEGVLCSGTPTYGAPSALRQNLNLTSTQPF